MIGYGIAHFEGKSATFCSFFEERLEIMDGLYYYKFVALLGRRAPVSSKKRDYHVYFAFKRKQCMIPEICPGR
ncbi:hypothetical protein AMQ83_30030 [Paenibacillus riograndensis]|nr:hypothetical protein AMQ83_30030 [Paenibacillus riograndensis]